MFFKKHREDRIFKPLKLKIALFVFILVGGVASISIEDVSAASTGYRPFSSQAAVTSSAGDNNGYETSPLNAQADGGGYATDTNSGINANSTTCGAGSDKHRWTFDDATINAINSASVIDGITLRMDIWTDNYSGATTTFWGARLSYDGGTTWTSTKQTATCSSVACESEQTFTLGGSADTWGRTWSASQLQSGNLVLETCNMDTGDSSGARDHFLDYLAINVEYSDTQTISGTAYQADGETPLDAGETIKIKVNSSTYTDTTDVNGAFSIGVAASAGDILTLYVDNSSDGSGDIHATTVTTASGLNLTGLDLYRDTVMVRSDDGSSITNSEIITGLIDSSDDDDIRFTVSGINVSLTSGMSLAVWSGDTYAPGGNVDVTNGDVSVLGTFTLTSSTLKLTTGRIQSIGGTMTGGTVQLVGDTDIASDFTFAYLVLGDDSATGTTTAESNFTVNNFLINNNHTFNASTYTLTVTSGGQYQGFNIDASGVFTASQSTVKYTNGAVFAETTYYNLECAGTAACVPDASTTTTITNNLIISSGTVGEFVPVASSTFVVGGNVTIASGATFKSPDTLRVAGSFTNSGTFTHMSSTIEFNGSGTQTITPGGSTFYNANFSGSGTYALAANTAIEGTTSLTGGTLDVGGYALTVATLSIGGGTLQMDTSGDTLKVGTALSMSSGAIVASDVATAPVIMTSGTPDTNFYSVSFTGGTLGIDELSINSVNASGIVVGSGVTITNFNKVTVGENFSTSGTDVILDITGQTKTLLDWVFPTTTTNRDLNVRANTSGTITMQNATGAFAGEDDDSDNGGTVTWGVSVSLSGTLYSDAGVTVVNCSAANRTIGVSVAGGAPTTATCSAVGGTFTVTGLTMSVGDILTVFVDGHANNAVTVMRTNTSELPLTNIDLYEGYVVVRDEDSTPITISNLADYDSVDQSGDIPFTVSGGNLDVSGATLYVNANDTFTPGGNLTLDDLYIATGASLVAGVGQSHTVSGSWTNAGTFTASTSTVTFDSGAAETVITGSSSFNNVVFNGAGSWILQDAMTTVGDVTVSAGLLDLDTSSLTVEGGDITGAGTISQIDGTTTVKGTGNITQSAGAYSFHNLTLGDGVATATTTLGGTIEVINDLSVSANHTMNGTADVSVIGNIGGAGTVTMSGGSFTQSIAVTGKTFGGSTTWTFNDLTFTSTSGTPAINASGSGAVTVAGTLTVAANTTLQAGARTWTLSNGNLAKPLVVSGTFTADTSTMVYSGDNDAGTVTIDDVTYYNLTLGGAVLEDYDAEGDLTVQNDLSINANATLKGTDNWTINGSATGAGAINLTGGVFAQVVAANETIGTTSGSNDWTFYNLTIENSSGAPTVTLAANGGTPGKIVVSGTLTVGNASDTSATTVDVTTNDRVLDANGDVAITSKGVLSASDSAVFTVAGNWSNSGTFTHNNGTVTFDAGDAGNTLSGTMTGSSAFYNLTFNNASGAWSTAVSLSVDNDLTITAGTFTGPVVGVASLPVAIAYSPGSINTLIIQGNFSNSGSFVHNDGLIKFTATDAGNTINFGGSEGSSVWFSGVGGEWSFEGDNELVLYNLIIQYGTVDSAIDLKVTSGLGGVLNDVGTLNITHEVDLEWDIATSGSKGSGNFATNWTFYNLIFSNSDVSPISITSAWRSDSVITINGQMIIGDSGDTSTTALTLGAQTWVLSGSDPIALSTNPVATFDPGTSTIKYTGSGTVVINDRVDYYNLTLDGAGTYQPPVGGDSALVVENNLNITNGTLDLNTNDPSLTVGGNVTIDGTLQASNSSNLTVTGSWTHNSVGGFVANGGTVVLTGSGQSDITGTQPTTFYNFTVDTAGKTIRFKKEQQVTFGGTLAAQGNNLNRIIFQSTSATSTLSSHQWLMNLTGDTDLTWVIVVNGGCVGGSNAVPSNQTLLNGGNNDNTCWPFVNIGIQYLFADGDGNGGGTPVSGGGGGGGSTGGSAEGSGGAEGNDGGGTPVDGGGDDGGAAPSP